MNEEEIVETVRQGRFKVGIIGVGQGGTSLGVELAKSVGMNDFNKFISFNLSKSDLDSVSNFIHKENLIQLVDSSFGSGKNRNKSKGLLGYEDIREKIINETNRVFNGECNLIFVLFSTGGGTGSGVGPILTSIIESDEIKKPSKNGKPLVFGIPLLPDQSEGEIAQENTIEALKEMSYLCDKKVARFILVDNNKYNDIKEDVTRWQAINADVVKFLTRYLTVSYTSQFSNLDFEDRMNALAVPGCHSFCTFNPENPTSIESPFVLPEGALVKKVSSEIPVGCTGARDEVILNVGCNVEERGIVGYYPKDYASDEHRAWPIVHFGGFSNLSFISESFQNRFAQIQQRSQKADMEDKSKGSGFSAIKGNNEYLNNKNSTSKVAVNNILEDLL